ncbi:helix-turn-helix domain-containing protein [Candidatus Woesearchaeota archaeon]|nr:helix-turn-helix domain-containing protein [Candidatus Woesearchaeota archaeon]
MFNDALRKIGLTDGEIKIYLSLLDTGSSSTGKIIKKSGISGSKTYEVLDRLIKKGLASFVVKNGVKYFEASPPNKILDYLMEKEQEIQEEKITVQKIIPKLLLKQNSSKQSEVKVFTGFDGLKTANEDIINTLKKGEEWLSMGLSEQPASWENYFNKRQIERAKKGIKHRHLLNEKYKSLYAKRKKLPFTEFKFLPHNFEMPTSTEIYKNKVLIFILIEADPVAIMIESKAVADSFRKYFEHIWETVKIN